MTQLLPRFLVVRFAPGSGANFLVSILQCSHGVGHWFEEYENNKNSVLWQNYFESVFPKDLSTWLVKEPISLMTLGTREIFSAKYPRGNDLSLEEFQNLEQKFCSQHYFDLVKNNLFVPIYWHKKHLPRYFANATFVDIMLDQPSLKWFDRSVYYKNFTIKQPNADKSITVYRNEHRPSIQPSVFTGDNEYIKTYKSVRAMITEEILDNPWRAQYLDKNNLDDHGLPRFKLILSDLLTFDAFDNMYQRLCKFLHIKPIKQELLKELHTIWRLRHDY